MAKRFEQFYKVKRNDNLGDPDYWNRRLDDVDRRLHEREIDGQRVVDAVDQMQSVALQRLDETFTPIIANAVNQLTEIGAFFEGHSDNELTIFLGAQTLTLDEATRPGWVKTDHVVLIASDLETATMVARVENYNRDTGVLNVTVLETSGAGTFTGWEIRVSAAPETTHATRTDNPHHVTAEQVNAYEKEVVDGMVDVLTTGLAGKAAATNGTLNNPTLTGNVTVPSPAFGDQSAKPANTQWVAQAIDALIGGAPGALDTLGELADVLGNNPAQITDILTALGNRLRFDAAQALTDGQRDQALINARVYDKLLRFDAAQTLTAPQISFAYVNLALFSTFVAYNQPHALTAAQQLQFQRNINIGAHTCGRLTWNSGTQLLFSPARGNNVRVNGKWYRIPGAGITGARIGVQLNGVDGQNLVLGQTYYVCLYETPVGSGTLAIGYVQPALFTHKPDITAGNEGTEVIVQLSNGAYNSAYTVIGMAYVDPGAGFLDAYTLSFNNRRFKKLTLSVGNVNTSSTANVALNAGGVTAMSWNDQDIAAVFSGQAQTTGGFGNVMIDLNGSLVTFAPNAQTYIYGSTGINLPFFCRGKILLSTEGLQVFKPVGATNSGTLSVFNGNMEVQYFG